MCTVHIREETDSYTILIENSEGKKLLAKPRHRWANNIKINVLKESIV
jgi:hypothetical protein